MKLRVTIDRTADAAYIYFRPIEDGGVARTEEYADAVNADFDRDGKLIGLEILNLRLLPQQMIDGAEDITGSRNGQ